MDIQFIVIIVCFAVAIILITALSFGNKNKKKYSSHETKQPEYINNERKETEKPAVSYKQGEPVIIKETIKEVVFILCPYCKTKCNQTDTKCPNCNGAL